MFSSSGISMNLRCKRTRKIQIRALRQRLKIWMRKGCTRNFQPHVAMFNNSWFSMLEMHFKYETYVVVFLRGTHVSMFNEWKATKMIDLVSFCQFSKTNLWNASNRMFFFWNFLFHVHTVLENFLLKWIIN